MTHGLLSSHVWIDAVFRGLELAALVVLGGVGAFRVLVLRSENGARPPESASRFERRVMIGAMWLFLAAMVGEFGHEATEMSRRPFSELGPVLWPIVTRTHFGRIWVAQLALLGLLAWLADGRGSPERKRRRLLLIVALLALTQSLSGHAANQGNWSPDVLVDWLHLLAVSFWAGGLAPLALLTPRLMASMDARAARFFLIQTLERFSSMAMACVGLLAATGLLSAAWRGVEWAALLESDYARVLTLKVALVAVAVGLGGVSRFLLLPRMRRDSDERSLATRRIFRRVVVTEAGVALAVLALAAVLTQLPPPGSGSAGFHLGGHG